jgi:hypothetical protein
MIYPLAQPAGAKSVRASKYAAAMPMFNNTYYVNSATDISGVTDCTSLINTNCGIDNAIAAFNTDTTHNDADEIVFASSIPVFSVTTPVQIINPTSGITLTIDGNGQSNTAVSGGGLHTVFDIGYDGGSSVDISGLTVEDAGNGGSPGYGSGIYNFGENSTSLTVTDSTISGNTANGGSAGGIYNDEGTLTVTDSTISGNKAPAATVPGGGYVGGVDNDGTATLTDDTIAGNTASETDGAGIYNNSPKTLTVGATIIANNTGGDCYGTVTDKGYNIDDDGSCGFSAANHSISHSTTLDLGTLADNGGLTETILPGETSSAVGVIPNPTTLGLVSVCPRTDQRGVASVGNCTVGAVEVVEGGFRISTSALPNAIPGTPYGPVTLQVADPGTSTSPYTTTLKWKKITLPKGLKLSSAGVLSGTPSTKLAAGPSSITVQVTETVTTLNGTKKVKTKTTVQATIPLTIT